MMASTPFPPVSRRRPSASWLMIPFTQPTVGIIHISLRTPTSPFLRLYPLKVRFGAPVLRFRVVVLRSTLTGVVCVFQQPGQVGLDIVFIHPVPLLLRFPGVADGISVFNDVFAFRKIFQCEFVSGRNILVQGDSLSVHREFFTGRECCDSHCNIVGRLIFRYFASIMLFTI